MLQPLGISAEAEAAYVALAPLSSASVDELAKLTGTTPDEVRDTLEELRRLGLATESSTNWRALPLLDVVNHLKVQRLSEIEMASVAAEALESHLLAAGETQDDEIKILVGRESIVAAHQRPAGLGQAGDLPLRQGAVRRGPARRDRGGPAGRAGVAGAGARHHACGWSTTPVSTRTG